MQVHDQEEVIMIKGKRSKRPRPPSPLSFTMATTSSSTAEISGGDDGFGFISGGGGSNDRRRTSSILTNSDQVMISQSSTNEEEEEDMAQCLILLARGRAEKLSPPFSAADESPGKVGRSTEVYQCKTCNKSFPSFQALGGHRASHKKPNKPTTIDEKPNRPVGEKQEDLQPNNTMIPLQISSKPRAHECSICGVEFASGQALGGHMRRHRPIPPPGSGFHGGESSSSISHEVVKWPKNMLSLDLNLPAPEEDHQRPGSKFAFGYKEQVTVFSASPLVDCHY